jgi:hypothetical protein
MANDTTVQDIMLVYRGILETTRDVFGKENMTEDVIRCVICEAGGMAWRMTNTEED